MFLYVLEIEPVSWLLTFIWSDLYLTVSIWFMRKVLFEQKEIKFLYLQHSEENKMEIIQHVLKMQ